MFDTCANAVLSIWLMVICDWENESPTLTSAPLVDCASKPAELPSAVQLPSGPGTVQPLESSSPQPEVCEASWPLDSPAIEDTESSTQPLEPPFCWPPCCPCWPPCCPPC